MFWRCIVVFSVLLPGMGLDAQDSERIVLGQDETLLAGIPGEGSLDMAEIRTWLANTKNHKPLDFQLPKGLASGSSNIFVPEDNPLTRAKIELGRQLYFDSRLSSDNSISCASCHDPAQGFAAQTQFGIGIDDQTGNRNSPVAYNRILSHAQFWDGRAATLEEQAVGPIENPIEMGNTHESCVTTLEEIPGYALQFESIFGNGVTIENVGKAIATFERALVTGPAPYDFYYPLVKFEEMFADDLEFLDEEPELEERYLALKEGINQSPMSDSAQRGMALFFDKARCAECHTGVNFTDEQYHNLGVGMDSMEQDLGRYEISKMETDRGAFKTPSLRNVIHSAPYMHDGSQKTLEEVVKWYDQGGHPNPWLSEKMKKPLGLTDQEQRDVVNFMKEGLTGSFPRVETGRLPK